MIRRIVLTVGAVVILAMVLYPPWLHGEFDGGYHFLLTPPNEWCRVNVQLLLLQIGAVALAAWFIAVALNRRGQSQ